MLISALRELARLPTPTAEEMDDIVVADLFHCMMSPSYDSMHINSLREIRREAPGKTLYKVMIDAHCIDSVRNEKQYFQHDILLLVRREVELVGKLIAHSVLEVSPDEGEAVRIDEQCGHMLTEG